MRGADEVDRRDPAGQTGDGLVLRQPRWQWDNKASRTCCARWWIATLASSPRRTGTARRTLAQHHAEGDLMTASSPGWRCGEHWDAPLSPRWRNRRPGPVRHRRASVDTGRAAAGLHHRRPPAAHARRNPPRLCHCGRGDRDPHLRRAPGRLGSGARTVRELARLIGASSALLPYAVDQQPTAVPLLPPLLCVEGVG